MINLKPLRSVKADSYLVRLYPELLRFDNDLDRGAAWRSVQEEMHCSGGLIFVFCSLLLCAAAYTFLIVRLHFHWLYSYGVYFVGILSYLSTYLLFRRSMRKSLRLELLMKGIPICLHCGYNLTGCTSMICPECGTDFER